VVSRGTINFVMIFCREKLRNSKYKGSTNASHVVSQTPQPITTWPQGMVMPLVGWPIPLSWVIHLGWLVPGQFNPIATNSTCDTIQ